MLLSILLAAAAVTTGCRKNYGDVDATQAAVADANFHFDKLKQQEDELHKTGVFGRATGGGLKTLTKTCSKLQEFIATSEAVLRAADRPDVAFGHRPAVEKKLLHARQLLKDYEEALTKTKILCAQPDQRLSSCEN